MAKVLVVEDEGAIADLLAINLRHAGHEVGHAADAAQALGAVDAALPDAVILDWMLPGESGVGLLRRWRGSVRTRDLPVIMLSGRTDERDVLQGLDAGADDYMRKPFSPAEMIARVRAVLRRRLPETVDSALRAGPVELDPLTMRVTVSGRQVRLGPTEFKLLRFLLAHPGRVHSRAQLLDRVWGDHVFIEERTVDVHVKRLREALSPDGSNCIIETVRGAGYRFAAPDDTATQRSG
jgi:two-component system, OmpR family, phosphate regulon response regulator PhoB